MSNVRRLYAEDIAPAEKLAWLRLSRTDNVGPATFYQLIDFYGTALKALEAVPGLAARGGRKKPLALPPQGQVEQEYETLRALGGDIVLASEKAYPLALGALPDAPPVLSYRGNLSLCSRPAVAMVGARNASLNGKKFSAKLAREIGQAGHVIVSGLARGIDTAAHEGALESGTIAVVAGGVDVVYPPENQALYDAICEKGLIIAESPLGQQPFAQSFPRRNRIVSGLSAGVVVVEATLKSGSLITARLAGDQGRDVYAVPGHPLDPRAEGPNHLIREGAVLVRSAQDILDHLHAFTGINRLEDSAANDFIPPPVRADARMLEEAREILLSALSPQPAAIDDLVHETGLSVSVILTVLLELELAGRAVRLPGNRVAALSAA